MLAISCDDWYIWWKFHKAWRHLFTFLNWNLLGLRRNVANFGRDNSSNENSDVFVFTPENCKIKYLERISKCHFTVEREAASFGKDGDRNYNPAILTCYGRNGMYVNDKKLQVGDKMILVHKDTIKLTRQFGLFEVRNSNIYFYFIYIVLFFLISVLLSISTNGSRHFADGLSAKVSHWKPNRIWRVRYRQNDSQS